MDRSTLMIPDWPWRTVLALAAECDARVWLVGGAVRDALLGRPLHDWDFAVEGDALMVARTVADALEGAYFPLDEQRDMARVVLSNAADGRLELDFARLQGGSLHQDLLARDFTINAIGLDPAGRLIDPLGGREDLAQGHVRAVRDDVFQADPLRLLRAVRLVAEMNLVLDPRTMQLMARDSHLLASPAAERVRDELVRIVCAVGAARFLHLMAELDLFASILPELAVLQGVSQTAPHRFDVWRHTLLVFDALEGLAALCRGADWTGPFLLDAPMAVWGDLARLLTQFRADLAAHMGRVMASDRPRAFLLCLAGLLHDVGKPATWSQDERNRIHFYGHEEVGASMVEARLRMLRFSRQEIAHVVAVVKGHLRPSHLSRVDCLTSRAIYRYYRDLGSAGVDVALLSCADHLATWGPKLDEMRWRRRLEVVESLLYRYFCEHDRVVAPDPFLTGHDLMEELKLEPGPQIGKLLAALREAQAAGEVSDRQQALALARRLVR
jgi:putative nucleotidyltransferase with HDIG domain